VSARCTSTTFPPRRQDAGEPRTNPTADLRTANGRTPWQRGDAGTTGGMLPVLCVPHAGGTAAAFAPWLERGRAAGMEFIPLELPGHGLRRHEQLLTSMRRVTDEVLTVLAARRPGEPFALLGHSMGALISYEVSRQLQREGAPLPELLIVSGARPPGAPGGQEWHQLPDERLLAAMADLGGLPEDVRRSGPLARLVVPPLRSDLTLLAEYHRTVSPEPLDCRMLALAGEGDQVADPRWTARWRDLTRGDFTHDVLPGGHFFLYDDPELTVEHLRCGVGAT